MYGRFTLTTNLGAVTKRLGVNMLRESAAHSPRYNIAPTQALIVVGDDGRRYLIQMHWGPIASWADASAHSEFRFR